MNNKLLLLSTILSTSFIHHIHAQSRIYVNEYLNIGVGARGLAMGGTQSATSEDVYAGYWNPAGLTSVQDQSEIGLMHAEYFAGIFKYDYAGFAIPLKDKKHVIGASFIRFATDNIPYTLDYVQPDGSFDESKLKSFSAGDYAALLSYAQQVNWFKNPEVHTSIGGNAKIIYRNVGSMANAWGVGLDLGLKISYKSWRFAVAAKDISTTATAWSFHLTEEEKQVLQQTGNEIPIKSYEVMKPRLNFGFAKYHFKPEKKFQLLTEFGFDVTTDGKRIALISSNPISVDPRIGIEASYKNTIFLRGGISNMYNATDNSDTLNKAKYFVFQPSMGVGFKLKYFSVDYAFTSLQMQDNPLYSHIVSLKLNLHKSKPVKTSVEETSQPTTTPQNTTSSITDKK